MVWAHSIDEGVQLARGFINKRRVLDPSPHMEYSFGEAMSRGRYVMVQYRRE